MTEATGGSPLRRWQRQYRGAYDALSILLYLAIVYGASLWIHPLGRDYAALALAEGSGEFVDRLFLGVAGVFGTQVVAYHLLNLLTLYACALLVYRIFRALYPEAPVWLATWSAAVFMASPVHAEAVLNISGLVDLLPALAGFWTLFAYAVWKQTGARPAMIAAAVSTGVSVLLFPELSGLPLLFPLYESLTRSETRILLAMWMAALVATAGGLIVHGLPYSSLDPARVFAPLYFVLYPIGFLPETAQTFHRASPVFGLAAAVVVIIVLLLIARKVRHPLFLYGLLGAAVVRGFSDSFVDPVHLTGGGSLLFSSGLACIALSVMFAAMMRHPKWRSIVVSGTTLLALLIFWLGFQNASEWRRAGDLVAEFQRDAGALYGETGADVSVLPDYQHYRGAPVRLSDSISIGTPFSDRVPHVSVLRLDYDDPARMSAAVTRVDASTLSFRVKRERVEDLWPWPYAQPGADSEAAADVTYTAEPDGTVMMTIHFVDGPAPIETIPVRIREPAGGVQP